MRSPIFPIIYKRKAIIIQIQFLLKDMSLYFFFNRFTLVESSNILVCSAMKRTQMQDLWTSGGQRECEKVGGLRSAVFLTSSLAASPETERSSHSVCNGRNGGNGGPWIKQLPPNLAPSVRLKQSETLLVVFLARCFQYREWHFYHYHKKESILVPFYSSLNL